MSESQREGSHLQPMGGGRFAIHGDLTFESATSVLEQSRTLFAENESILVDMTGVEDADSAGLALLIEWLSWASKAAREITYENVPEEITAIAEISEVSNLINASSSARA